MNEMENDKDCARVERTPSPEPFREPDGMVTIDLNRRSPTPPFIKSQLKKPKKIKVVNLLCYIALITIVCITSFTVAIYVHRKDIQWFASNLREIEGNLRDSDQIIIQRDVVETQTCPLNFEEYKNELAICEQTKSLEKCCYNSIRERLAEMNHICNLMELLNSLEQYQKIIETRVKRQSYNSENEYKEESAKEKFRTYIHQFQEPLRKELPDLLDWSENLVFGNDKNEENYQNQENFQNFNPNSWHQPDDNSETQNNYNEFHSESNFLNQQEYNADNDNYLVNENPEHNEEIIPSTYENLPYTRERSSDQIDALLGTEHEAPDRTFLETKNPEQHLRKISIESATEIENPPHLYHSVIRDDVINEHEDQRLPNKFVEQPGVFDSEIFQPQNFITEALPRVTTSTPAPKIRANNQMREPHKSQISKFDKLRSETTTTMSDPDESIESHEVTTGAAKIPTTNTDIMNAVDSIQSIDNVSAKNKSVKVDLGKLRIVISNNKNFPLEFTTEENTNGSRNETENKEKSERGSSNLDFRGTQQHDFDKTKGNPFPSINEDVQTSQNTFVNPCLYAYSMPYRQHENPQILNVLPNQNQQRAAPVYVINPSVFSYAPPMISHYATLSQSYNPYGYLNAAPNTGNANGALQVTGANGQYYLCKPISQPGADNIANIPGVEIRRSSSNLQESVDMIKPEIRPSNKSRAALNCPVDEQSCLDGSKCISLRHICDNEIHCDDGSDEMFCTCRDRIGEIRLCDGYFDCPDGEDEKGCFGCTEDEISCDDWSRFRKGNCVPMEQRCDGIRQCEVTGKDEDDCSILTDHLDETNPIKISNSAGFLHRNYKGKWYPTCFGSEVWAMDVCKVEAGPSTSAPKSHLILTSEKYEGDFINILPNQEISLVGTCVQDRASFVECPPMFCGLRMSIRNPYRPQEVDTSIEDIVNHLNRGNILDESISGEERATNNSRTPRDAILGDGRVVGGKPSQPAAWPWVISIYKNGIFHCGGVIINELWILTAAHCVDKYWQFYYEVQAGILRRFSYSPMEQTRFVVRAIAHESYDKSNLKNDIALMRLSTPLRYNRYIRPICLPSETTAGRDFFNGPSPGTICTTVGWGAMVEHGSDPDHMREVEVPVLKSCKHREDEEGHEICAGLFEGGKDACQGDSGGPFMCQNPNNPSQWYLAGIVSHGEGCARPNEPGVYTRVSQYIEWIAENMKEGAFVPRAPLRKCPGYVCKGINKCIPKKRHCDKIVDCLMGDDEVNCENSFNNIFKHSRRTLMPFFRSSSQIEDVEDGGVVGAAVITADDGTNSTMKPLDEQISTEKPLSISRIYKYERYINDTNENTVCTKILQTIPAEKVCDKVIDCEDGTDEKNCKCVDYLKYKNPDVICDGIVDCADGSDEQFCVNCKKEEFDCKRSQTCISNDLRCDGKPDCSKGEDERDCVALTNGKTLLLDKNLRPILNTKGIISVNRHGIWMPYCISTSTNAKTEAEIATNVCNYLGFEEYIGFKKWRTRNQTINIKNFSSGAVINGGPNSKCDGLYLWCSNITLAYGLIDVNKRLESDELNSVPWNAIIYSNGKYKCMGAVLDEEWIVAPKSCFDGLLINKMDYVAVSLGKGVRTLNVTGPHEKTLRVIKSVVVNDTNIVLLKMETILNFDRYIQATHLNVRLDKKRDEKCIATGMSDDGIKLIFLKSNQTCALGRRCFGSFVQNKCKGVPWKGVVTCNSGNGWYPASVFEIEDVCAFNVIKNFTNIKEWEREMVELKKDTYRDIVPFFCDGFLCNLGKCIENRQICDGIPDCEGGEDEDGKACKDRNTLCHLSGACPCPVDHLTCTNGLCVPKEKFCDAINDCGDRSDEPASCTCRSYMQLAHPEKICDGHLNCFDRSDEDPKLCRCKSSDFKCGKGPYCVPEEMVCDGTNDCPDGQDENSCYTLSSNHSTYGDVLLKTAGRRLKSCFPASLSTEDVNKICKQIGFDSCIGHNLEPYDEGVNTTLDSFRVVWIRRGGNNPLTIALRTGNDPYLYVRKQKTNCHRLYIECE